MNEIAKVPTKRGRLPHRPKAGPADMSWVDRLEPLNAAAAALERPRPEAPKRGDWVDRFAGTLDEDFARAALDRPDPECWRRG